MTQDPARSVASLASARAALERIEVLETFGRVVAIRGPLGGVAGPVAAMRLGGRVGAGDGRVGREGAGRWGAGKWTST
ncbi:hypothetical protein CCS92_35585 [Methylobacterium radiotolerans]|nr:hypothetical protein CCS92_35585 [Methylobacterium radiotolerans]